jgi:hypothetical protein
MFDGRAIPAPRGCGERKPGGVYAECGLSPFGSPLEHFLLDPPLPLPEGVDLVNKPQLWLRTDPASGLPVLDPETERPIYDLLIWVGAEYYPEATDYIEETRQLGASRRLNPQMDLSKLTRRSRMLLAHPRAIIASWRDLLPPEQCKKGRPNHDRCFSGEVYQHGKIQPGEQEALDARFERERAGPCIFKLWETLPREEAIQVFERESAPPLCLRHIGSTTYEYRPTGEKVTAWQPGFFLGLPITNIALIQYSDGSVNETARKKLVAGKEQNGSAALDFYETDE